MKEESAAIITIKKPASMSARGRKSIAKWMRKQAEYFEEYGREYSEAKFTARYIYTSK